MSHPDFEAMLSDEKTTYQVSDSVEDEAPAAFIANKDGTMEQVELDDDDDDQAPSVEELKSYKTPSERTENRIGRLTFEREEARRETETYKAALAEAQRQNQALMQERSTYANTNLQMADTMRNSMKSAREKELESAKAAMSKAFSDGDEKAMADAQAEIARVQSELTQIHMAEQNAKQYKAYQANQTARQYTQAQQQPAQQPEMMPASTARWIASNQHWFNKPDFMAETQYAVALHGKLLSEGHEAGSEAYFNAANKTLSETFPHLNIKQDQGVMNGSQNSNNAASRPNVAAPSNRRSGKDPRNKKVTLTPSQVSIAKKLGITPAQYAAQLMKKDYN